eukprot:6206274-Pleurochrysis_carterae.AAC.1
MVTSYSICKAGDHNAHACKHGTPRFSVLTFCHAESQAQRQAPKAHWRRRRDYADRVEHPTHRRSEALMPMAHLFAAARQCPQRYSYACLTYLLTYTRAQSTCADPEPLTY